MLEMTVNANELIQAGIGFTMRDDETGFYQCEYCALAQSQHEAALKADGHSDECEGCDDCSEFAATSADCHGGKCGEIIGVFAYSAKDADSERDAKEQDTRANALRRRAAAFAAVNERRDAERNLPFMAFADGTVDRMVRDAYDTEYAHQSGLTDIEVLDAGEDVVLQEYDGGDVYSHGACTMLAPTSEGGDLVADMSDMSGEALEMARLTASGNKRTKRILHTVMYLGGQANAWAELALSHIREMGEMERDDALDGRPLWAWVDGKLKPQNGAEAGYWARIQRIKAERLVKLLNWVDAQARLGQYERIRSAIGKWRKAYSDGVKYSVAHKRRATVHATRPYSNDIVTATGSIDVRANWSKQWLSRTQMDTLELAVKVALGTHKLPSIKLNASEHGIRLSKGSGYIRRSKVKPEREVSSPLQMPTSTKCLKMKRRAARFSHLTATFTW
jgi:hypothetical protein